jgi:hypothetical protein
MAPSRPPSPWPCCPAPGWPATAKSRRRNRRAGTPAGPPTAGRCGPFRRGKVCGRRDCTGWPAPIADAGAGACLPAAPAAPGRGLAPRGGPDRPSGQRRRGRGARGRGKGHRGRATTGGMAFGGVLPDSGISPVGTRHPRQGSRRSTKGRPWHGPGGLVPDPARPGSESARRWLSRPTVRTAAWLSWRLWSRPTTCSGGRRPAPRGGPGLAGPGGSGRG